LLRLVVLLLLLLRVPLQARLEVCLLQHRRSQLGGELAPERVRAGGNRAHARRVRGVLVMRALALARADPEDEGDDDRDRDRDEADEARERHETGRRGRRPRRAGALSADATARTRSLLRLRLVEKVELDVLVVERVHAVSRSGQTVTGPPLERKSVRCRQPEYTDVQRARSPAKRARPRSLPADSAARERRVGLRLARPRREDRPRRRVEDRRPRGKGGGARRARGVRRRTTAPSELSARIRIRTGRPPRL